MAKRKVKSLLEVCQEILKKKPIPVRVGSKTSHFQIDLTFQQVADLAIATDMELVAKGGEKSKTQKKKPPSMLGKKSPEESKKE